VVSKFPAASFAVRVSVDAVPDAIVLLETLITEVAVLMTPGLTVIVGRVVVSSMPPMLQLKVVADPLTTPVKLAV
jgi:hypothetical protein